MSHEDATMAAPCGCHEDESLYFGEDGEMLPGTQRTVLIPSTGVLRPLPDVVIRQRPCALATLNGSWLLDIPPKRPTVLSPKVRGPLRIEVGPSSLRVSGDVYSRRERLVVSQPVTIPTPVIDPIGPVSGRIGSVIAGGLGIDQAADGAPSPGWYPSFPKSEYAWYFRSIGATYSAGTLTVSIVRHLWNRSTQEFAGTENGTLTLTCTRNLLGVPNPLTMSGTLTIGGQTSPVTATKTSDFYRGCRVEVDVMTNRLFPASATVGSGAVTNFRAVYATAGWDVTVATDELNVPEDASLTNAELATLLSGHRQRFSGEDWRLWLLVGSSQGTLFGIMFDEDSVPREGAAGFADVNLGSAANIHPDARNRPLDEVPAAFLRTLVHEAGHAFNLFHPKHDVHNPPIGTEIMNQTGDVMSFATVTNPYPNNASFFFAEHDRTSLIHSPDPQVRPGWKGFGWGHGDLSAGLASPVDVAGLALGDEDDDLVVTVDLPAQAFVGEFLTAKVSLSNVGTADRQVTTLLTLAEGDLTFVHTTPAGTIDHVLDIAVGCGPRPTVTLAPGESVSNYVQVFFTNQGFTFDSPGRHTVVAQLAVDSLTTIRSAPYVVDVRSPSSAEELDIAARTLDSEVGRAFALGDFAGSDRAAAMLTELAENHTATDTGAASALVMANSLARSFTDFRVDSVRLAQPDDAARFLDLAVQGRSAQRVVELAVAVASPTEKDAPVVQDSLDRVRRARKGKADVAGAVDVAADFVQVTPR